MTSRTSTPSEGEILESDSEKATPSLPSVNGTKVDRQSRKHLSVSRSPSPVRTPKSTHSRPRTRSRSPYREYRGTKRTRDVDQEQYHERIDPRRFKVHYEERPYGDRSKDRSRYNDLDSGDGRDPTLRYDDRNMDGRSREKRQRTRSRSVGRANGKKAYSDRHGRDREHARSESYAGKGKGSLGNKESKERLSREQSVSDRGHPSIATASSKREAETSKNQAQQDKVKRVDFAADNIAKPREEADNPVDEPILDEAALIETRRKKREAIKAKYKGQETPMLVQALALNSGSAPNSPIPDANLSSPNTPGSPQLSPAQPVENGIEQESVTAFELGKDRNIANDVSEELQEDEPSAADYDPTMDMQEDKRKHDQRHFAKDVASGDYEETKATKQDVLLPAASIEQPISKKPKNEFDMFADEDDDDMFAERPTVSKAANGELGGAVAVPIPQAKALDMSMLDDWDDDEGYYKVILGELLDNRYHVQSNLGRGMFSGVVRAMDQTNKKLVAIKLIRNNETMKKAGMKEIEILQTLGHADPEDKKHIIRLERYFEHKGHLCMVFENLNENLREVLKKFGRDVGINIRAVRTYAQQMFLGLSLLRKCNILHADLKPDNVLVNESRSTLKICDLGSASDASENEITPYLVSRFYRAPEIMLGMPYDFAIDIWSVGCTLFELYTGKILFTGRTNNQMLRSIMECRGKLNHKLLRKAQFSGLHFDDLLNFRSVEKDKISGKDTVRILPFTKPSRDLRSRVLGTIGKGMGDAEAKDLNLFIDLLDRCLNLNPEKRCTASEALRHPFIMRKP